jgi:hypothetical protein
MPVKSRNLRCCEQWQETTLDQVVVPDVVPMAVSEDEVLGLGEL